jgi:hypothetical protein
VRAHLVVREAVRGVVLGAVDLDGERCLGAVEVEDVGAGGVLASELGAAEAT